MYSLMGDLLFSMKSNFIVGDVFFIPLTTNRTVDKSRQFISSPLLWFYLRSIAVVLFPVHCCGFIISTLLWFNIRSISVDVFPVNCCVFISSQLLWFYFQSIAMILLLVLYSGFSFLPNKPEHQPIDAQGFS